MDKALLAIILSLGVLPVLVLVLISVVLGLRHARLLSEHAHKERLRAIELGQPLAGEEHKRSLQSTIVSIGAGVPITVFGIAWLAAYGSETEGMIWLSAGLIGVSAIVGATVLAVLHLIRGGESQRSEDPYAKPTFFEADAFEDVAGSHR